MNMMFKSFLISIKILACFKEIDIIIYRKLKSKSMKVNAFLIGI